MLQSPSAAPRYYNVLRSAIQPAGAQDTDISPGYMYLSVWQLAKTPHASMAPDQAQVQRQHGGAAVSIADQRA